MKKNDRGWSVLATSICAAPLIAACLFFMLERVCGSTKDGVGRYCSAVQLWPWLLHEGGWWKVTIFAGVVAFVGWGQAANDEAKAQEERAAKHSGRGNSDAEP